MQWIDTGVRGSEDVEGEVDVNTLAMDMRMGRCQKGKEVEVVGNGAVDMAMRCTCLYYSLFKDRLPK
jgi:hypothetical protein